MNLDYEILYPLPADGSDHQSTPDIKKLEKRMKAIKRRKIIHTSDKSWSNKFRFTSKIYDNWYSPLNDKTLKNDSAYMQLTKCDYQSLVDLLFTSGELDTDKVICLHVLASHPCDKLALPPTTEARFETQTTLERLIERSKSFCGYRTGSKYKLPIYILNLNEGRRHYFSTKYGRRRITDSQFQDGRLATRLVINENLRRLVQTVIEALHHCNPPKMLYLLKIAQNINYVRHIMNTPQLQSFMKALSNQKIVLSSDSFLLTRPFETCVEIKIENPSHTLEFLISKIRRHVLFNDHISEKKRVQSANQKLNIKGIQREIDVCLDYCNFDAEKISLLLNAKIKKAQQIDLKKIRRNFGDSPPCEYTSAICRKHKCIACTEKWKINLLSEKITEKTEKVLEDYKPKYSNSTQWLKFIIQEEEENLRKIKTKTIISSFNLTITEITPKKPMILNINERRRFAKIRRSFSHENINTNYAENNLNLAKIRNEISTKENSKRIKKFLEEPIYTRKNYFQESDYSVIQI